MDDRDGRLDGDGDGRARARRKVHLDGGAVAFLAVDLDVPGRLLDEAIDHAEPEPGALAGALRGEERIEHLVEDPRGNTDAGVAHRDQRVTAVPDVLVGAC